MTMGRLGEEARGAMTVLLERGHTKSDVARLLGVSEGTVRYHERRMKRGAIDGRSLQAVAASVHADAIEYWRG
jgi:DNA-binding CsgD family transcriptional regulator